MPRLDVVIIGGGMITHDVLLPAVYHLQRTGRVGDITICAYNNAPLRELVESEEITQAFPEQKFTPYPDFSQPAEMGFPTLYQEVLAGMAPRQIAIVALPDNMHYAAVRAALEADQHVLCVKPLVLKYDQAEELAALAWEKGLFVGIEYHKRFDRRALIARGSYTQGKFGEFKLGEARLIEPYYYRHSNFQNWFTCENSDPFTYVGCHYVDLVYYITGLRPVEVSVSGITGAFPNGNLGYLWSAGRVRYENGALLNVLNGLGYPDMGSGSNDQCLSMYCEGGENGALIKHDDQFRGVTHSYLQAAPGAAHHKFINPDFFRYVPWEGEGFRPAGYGYDSVEANLATMLRLEETTAGLLADAALAKRQEIIAEVDRKGIIATPRNSAFNELVTEAARISILQNGLPVQIEYNAHPHVVAGARV